MPKFVKELFEAYFDPRLMSQYFNKDETIVTPYKFTRVERFILIFLYYEGEHNMGDLSAKFYLPKSTTNQTVTRLKDKKLLDVSKDSKDKRVYNVRLTNYGKEVTHTMLQAFHQHVTRFFWILTNKLSDILSDEEKAVTKKIHEKLESKEI